MAQLDLARLEQAAMQDPELKRLLQETYQFQSNAGGARRGNGNQVGRGGGIRLQQQVTQRLRELGIDPRLINLNQKNGELQGLEEAGFWDRNSGRIGTGLRIAGLGYLGGSAIGALSSGGGAAAAPATGAGGSGAITGSLPSSLSFGPGMPAAGGAAGGGGAAAGGGGIGGFLNSNAGLMALQSALRFGEGALTPDETQHPFNELDGELGRLLKPENAAYIGSRTGLEFGKHLAGQLGQGAQTGPMPGQLPSINVPGLPFQLGGVGQASSAFQPPAQNPGAPGLTKWLENLLAPPPPPQLVPQAPPPLTPQLSAPQASSGPTQPRTQPRMNPYKTRGGQ